MKVKSKTLPTFVAISLSLLVLISYLVVTKTYLPTKAFIANCTQIIMSLTEHIHVDRYGLLSGVILSIFGFGLLLLLIQLLKFSIDHKKLNKINQISKFPQKIRTVLNRHNIDENRLVVIASNKLTAYTIGLFRSKIVISKALINQLTVDQLEAIILHEIYHVKSRHLFWLLISRLSSSLFFFVPFVSHLAERLKTEFEIASDSFVVNKQGTSAHLRSSLAFNLEYVNHFVPYFATAPIEKRVTALVGDRLKFEKMGIGQLTVSLFSMILMLSLVFVQPTQAASNLSIAGEVCSVETGCQTSDCTGYDDSDALNHSPFTPASFPFSSSH